MNGIGLFPYFLFLIFEPDAVISLIYILIKLYFNADFESLWIISFDLIHQKLRGIKNYWTINFDVSELCFHSTIRSDLRHTNSYRLAGVRNILLSCGDDNFWCLQGWKNVASSSRAIWRSDSFGSIYLGDLRTNYLLLD